MDAAFVAARLTVCLPDKPPRDCVQPMLHAHVEAVSVLPGTDDGLLDASSLLQSGPCQLSDVMRWWVVVRWWWRDTAHSINADALASKPTDYLRTTAL